VSLKRNRGQRIWVGGVTSGRFPHSRSVDVICNVSKAVRNEMTERKVSSEVDQLYLLPYSSKNFLCRMSAQICSERNICAHEVHSATTDVLEKRKEFLIVYSVNLCGAYVPDTISLKSVASLFYTEVRAKHE